MVGTESNPEAFITCPRCGNNVLKVSASGGEFQCPNCGAKLIRMRGRTYGWLRLICCLSGGFYYAWTHGWEGSFVVFALSFYVFAAAILWDVFVAPFFPKNKIQLQPLAFPWIHQLTGL
jgi:predicted RNA-binding Zn-ribbon protein involved in translation (DUF1610 family)